MIGCEASQVGPPSAVYLKSVKLSCKKKKGIKYQYILIRSKKMLQYAGTYLLQNYFTCFGCPSHPSSEVHKTVTAASGTGHITHPGNNLPPEWPN